MGTQSNGGILNPPVDVLDNYVKKNTSFVNVRDFGAIGDSVANDSAAFQAAVDFAAPLGKGVYVPWGTYLVSTVNFDLPTVVIGDGGEDDGTALATTRIVSASSTDNTFNINAKRCRITGIKFINTAATVTAGAALKFNLATGSVVRDVAVVGYWIGVDFIDGVAWLLDHVTIYNVGKYAVRINNSVADGGDQYINNCLFSGASGTRDPDAAIRYESGGGLKISNTKINSGTTNRYDFGIDLAWTKGPSGVLIITGCSIENISVDGIRLDGGAQNFSNIVISGVEIALLSNTVGSGINITKSGAGQIQQVTIGNITVQQTGGVSTGYAVKAQTVATLSLGVITAANNLAGRRFINGCTTVRDAQGNSERTPKASLPNANQFVNGEQIYVTDEVGGQVIAFSDATNWRRVTDRAVVS